MPKNILIFSDGTGQAGGLRPDQRLSNIYKLYRATRTSITSKINPKQQIAFYDSGLGSGEKEEILLHPFAFIRKLLSAGAGLGIARNTADCYEEILKRYEPGDHIYLFGFSRGAYTIRNVAGVLNLCGIPVSIDSEKNNNKPFPKRGRVLREVAEEAVGIYRHGAGKYKDKCKHDEKSEYEKERNELARRFRQKYSSFDCSEGNQENSKSNVAPYFIGAFDTVAALGVTPKQKFIILLISLVLLAIPSLIVGVLLGQIAGFSWVSLSAGILLSIVSFISISIFRRRFRLIKNYPEVDKPSIYFRAAIFPIKKNFSWHVLPFHFKSYENFLDNRTRFVRHALSIDEHRKIFKRVKWGCSGVESAYKHKSGEPWWFIQKWFSGNHSDIGGSYPESESRLSDIALSWMVDELKKVSKVSSSLPLDIDMAKLNLFPDSSAMQHCEIYEAKDKKKRLLPIWEKEIREIDIEAPLHESVLERFAEEAVQQCDVIKPYRPDNLRNHEKTKHYYVD